MVSPRNWLTLCVTLMLINYLSSRTTESSLHQKDYFPCFMFLIPLWSHCNWKRSPSRTGQSFPHSLIHSSCISRTFTMNHGIRRERKSVLSIKAFVPHNERIPKTDTYTSEYKEICCKPYSAGRNLMWSPLRQEYCYIKHQSTFIYPSAIPSFYYRF